MNEKGKLPVLNSSVNEGIRRALKYLERRHFSTKQILQLLLDLLVVFIQRLLCCPALVYG